MLHKLLSAAEGQGPRNYSSCCCSCCGIFSFKTHTNSLSFSLHFYYFFKTFIFYCFLWPYLSSFYYICQPTLAYLPRPTCLCLSTYTYLSMSTYLHQPTYLPMPTYLCLPTYINILTYLWQPTNICQPTYPYQPTSTYLPTYINTPTYLCLLTNTYQPMSTYHHLPTYMYPKYQYIISVDPGADIGLVATWNTSLFVGPVRPDVRIKSCPFFLQTCPKVATRVSTETGRFSN